MPETGLQQRKALLEVQNSKFVPEMETTLPMCNPTEQMPYAHQPEPHAATGAQRLHSLTAPLVTQHRMEEVKMEPLQAQRGIK